MQLDIFRGGVSSSAVKSKSWRFQTRSRIKASYKCQGCGIRFHPKKGDRLKFCSRECAYESKRAKAEAAQLTNQEAQAERRAKVLAEIEAKRLARQEQREARRKELGSRPCNTCGKPVGLSRTLWPRTYCSNKCKPSVIAFKSSPSFLAGRRARRKARKLKLRCITVERFDPVEILQRDGWRCHICKVSTPSRLRGTYKPNAPELDHIVPVAAGGDHSRVNTACICRRCNINKGSMPMGQLRLIG